MFAEVLFFNIGHFSLSVLTAFVYFAAGLLYLDSWKVDKLKKTPLIRSIGFFCLSIVASMHAASVELVMALFLMQLLKIGGLILILSSLISEPILHPPGKGKLRVFVPFAIPLLSTALIPLSGVLMLLIAAVYFRRVNESLDKQLKPAVLAFLFLGIAEILRIPFFWSDTAVVFWSKILATFGPLWSMHHIFELIGILILALWVWGYIRFRLQIQLFTTTVALTLCIFIITTFFFVFLLLRNLEADALSHLKTDVRVVQYAIERLEAESLAIATAVAENPEVKTAFSKNNENDLYKLTSNLMLSYNTNFLSVVNDTGRVVMRGEDKESVGDTLIFDPTVKSALDGQHLATVVSREGAIAPRIQINASVPFYEGANVRGAISTGFWIDSAFVDGVKDVTGLDVTVFGGNKRAATTFLGPDKKSRFVGTLEPNKDILNTVLEKGETFAGVANVLNQPYYTVYAPLKTYGDRPIGMLFVGKPQITLFETAKKSIDLTFLGSMILIVLSLIPAYLFSRFLSEQLEA